MSIKSTYTNASEVDETLPISFPFLWRSTTRCGRLYMRVFSRDSRLTDLADILLVSDTLASEEIAFVYTVLSDEEAWAARLSPGISITLRNQ